MVLPPDVFSFKIMTSQKSSFMLNSGGSKIEVKTPFPSRHIYSCVHLLLHESDSPPKTSKLFILEDPILVDVMQFHQMAYLALCEAQVGHDYSGFFYRNSTAPVCIQLFEHCFQFFFPVGIKGLKVNKKLKIKKYLLPKFLNIEEVFNQFSTVDREYTVIDREYTVITFLELCERTI